MLTLPTRNCAFKGTNLSLVQRGISPNSNLEKLAREASQLVSEKEKQDWKSNNCWFDKKRKAWFRPNRTPVLWLYNFHSRLLWMHETLGPLQNDSMHGSLLVWRLNKAGESTCLIFPTCPKDNQGSFFPLPPNILNYTTDYSRFANGVHTASPASWIEIMF